jgi:hypothetical protein
VKVVGVIVAGFIASEKVAVALADGLTAVAPLDGATKVTVGAVASTVQARLAGVGSGVPAWSTARTSKVWPPSGRSA